MVHESMCEISYVYLLCLGVIHAIDTLRATGLGIAMSRAVLYVQPVVTSKLIDQEIQCNAHFNWVKFPVIRDLRFLATRHYCMCLDVVGWGGAA
jgi:hypothetical protein